MAVSTLEWFGNGSNQRSSQDQLFSLVKAKDAEALGGWFKGQGQGVDPNPRFDRARCFSLFAFC